MDMIIVNGSPKSKRNTGSILEAIGEGAKSKGISYELIDLYKINYKGCTDCLNCKIINGISYGRCILKDGLKPVLDKLHAAGIIVFGSPIYYGTQTGQMRMMLERFWFQYMIYSNKKPPLAPAKLSVGMVYTMEDDNPENYNYITSASNQWMNLLFGKCETFISSDNLHLEDYKKYDNDFFDMTAKLEKHKHFGNELKKAFEFGVKLVPDYALNNLGV